MNAKWKKVTGSIPCMMKELLVREKCGVDTLDVARENYSAYKRQQFMNSW